MIRLCFNLIYILCFLFSMYDEAMVKSVIIKTYPTRKGFATHTNPTLNEMYESQFTSHMKYPIIAINRNVGTTTSYDPRQSLSHQFSFGIPHYFFRFNFTSAINEKPYSYVNWIKFKATSFYRTCFMGHIVGEDFFEGPTFNANVNSYVSIDEYIPSRFAMMFEKPNVVGFECAFISMDPERMGETTNDGLFTDVGDNVLSYKSIVNNLDISDDVENYAKLDLYHHVV